MPKNGTSKLKGLRASNAEIRALAVPSAAQVSAPKPPAPPVGGIKKTDTGMRVETTYSLDDLLENLCALTGTGRNEVAVRIAGQVAGVLQVPQNTPPDSILMQAIGMIAEVAPLTATESLLAAQMIASHDAAFVFMKRAMVEGQTTEAADANVLRATRLMRLHLDQIEAMQKLKGKAGQQKVVVEHVHVHVNEGGHAIVGAVNAKGEGGGGQ